MSNQSRHSHKGLSSHYIAPMLGAHEWPAGILYGHNGATLQECTEIREAVAEARSLDNSGVHSAFLADFEIELNEYISRLEAK